MFVAVNNRFSNYFYALVAENDPNLVSDSVASVVVSPLWFVACNSFGAFYIKADETERSVKSLEQKYKGGVPDSEKKEINIEEDIKDFKARIKKTKVVMGVVVTVVFLTFLYYSFMQSTYTAVKSRNIAFRNRLTVLSLHLSDNEIKQLKAKWVQMKSAHDYEQVNKVIAYYFIKYNIAE